MGSVVGNSVVSYCCVWKGGRILYAYNNSGEGDVENLAALCLEMAPPHHRWYFQTMDNNTYGFFMDDGHVYFAIVYQSRVNNSHLLWFLQKLRDEFRRSVVGKRPSLSSLQQHLSPVVRHLAASLAKNDSLLPLPLSNNNNGNGHMITEGTKAPLLGKKKNNKKKKMEEDEHVVIGVRETEIQEHRRSSSSSSSTIDGGVKVDSNDQGVTSASDLSSTRIRNSSSSQNLLKKKWCRQVRIILAVDAAVCLLLLVIWLVVCHGINCIR